MTIKKLYRPFGIFFSGVFFLTANSVLGAPKIAEVALVHGSGLDTGTVIEVTGEDFGDKSRGAPVLVDYVSHAYEYGKLNRRHSKLENLEALPVGRNGDEEAVWATRTSNVVYATSRPKRHPDSAASYLLTGHEAWFGGPVAYGGKSGWDTPTDNSQLYVSWWYKNKHNTTWYWRFKPEHQEGSFIPDERLEISTGGLGTYIGIDEYGLHNVVLPGHRNNNKLVGATIVGQKSGAKAVFPEQKWWDKGPGWRSPGSKLARIWDDPSGHGPQGIRSSVALHNFYVSTPKGYKKAMVYDNLKLPSDEWVHLEYELDTDQGIVRMYEDNRLRGEGSFDPEAIYEGKYSPTLSLIGVDGKQLMLQESEISEIYIDSALQRVVIGDAAVYDDVKHHEVQRPLAWNSGKIRFSPRIGGLRGADDLYLYVFNSGSEHNRRGFPLCDEISCASPPAPVELKVE